MIAPLSGPLAAFGMMDVQAARMAVREANREGGLLLGKTRCLVELVEKDGGSPEQSLEAAQELITKDRASAIIGPGIPVSAVSVAILAERSGIPVILRIPTSRDVTRGTHHVFRVTFDDEQEGAAITHLLRDELKIRNVAILYDASNLGNSSVVGAFRQRFSADGERIVAVQTFVFGQKSFRDELRRIKKSRPECLFLPNYSYDILKQREEAIAVGISASVVCSDVLSFARAQDLARLEGVWFCAHYDPRDSSPKIRAFVDALRSVDGQPPGPGAALTYDGCCLLMEAARASGSVTPEGVNDGLQSIPVFEGVTGTMRFGGSPNPRKAILMMRVLKGEARMQLRIDP